MIKNIQQFDVQLFLKIHRGLSNDFFDWFLPLMRNRFFWAPLYLFIFVYCLKTYQKKGYYIFGGFILTFAIGDLIASKIIKPLVGRVRPCNDINLVNEIIHRVQCGSGYSFPSTHATNHFGLAVFLICIFYPKWKGILPIALAWAFIVSFAQIYVGVHYPVDTFFGMLIGITVGLFTGNYFKKYTQTV